METKQQLANECITDILCEHHWIDRECKVFGNVVATWKRCMTCGSEKEREVTRCTN